MEVAALRWAIGTQPAEQLPDLATDALVRGLDSPALRELAGMARDDFWRIKSLFEVTTEELGIVIPDEQTALWLLAKNTAAEIVAGTVSPSRGADWIWWEIHHRIAREGDLRVFGGLASEWDEYAEHRAEIEGFIVDAARELIDQAEPRRWLMVQAQHGRSPVADSGSREELRPTDLPISEDLAHSLADWATDYDATFATEPDGFQSEEEAVTFVERGRDLVGRLQDELGEHWHVEYMPEPIKPPGLRLRRAD